MSLSSFFDYLEDLRLLKLFHYSNAIIENAEEIGRRVFCEVGILVLTKIFIKVIRGCNWWIFEFTSICFVEIRDWYAPTFKKLKNCFTSWTSFIAISNRDAISYVANTTDKIYEYEWSATKNAGQKYSKHHYSFKPCVCLSTNEIELYVSKN